MKMHYSSTGEFNNSRVAYKVPVQELSAATISSFTNNITVAKSELLIGTTGGWSLFNNSMIPSTTRTTLVVGIGSTVAWYDNGAANTKQTLLMGYLTSGFAWFDNSVDNNGGDKPKVTVGKTSTQAWFNNAYESNFAYAIGNWSVGVFDLENNISLLQYDEYNFDAIKADLLWPELTFNWFDNSVPSTKAMLQFRNIPWGFGLDHLQFSIRFPKLDLPIQYDIADVSKKEYLENQFFATPPHDDDANLELQSEIELDKFNLEIQLRDGKTLDRVMENQLEVLHDRIDSLDLQNMLIASGEDTLEMQHKVHKEQFDNIEKQFNIDKFKLNTNIELQFKRAYLDNASIELQNEVLKDRKEMLDIQLFNSANVNYSLDMQNIVSWPTTSTVELQFKRAYKTNENLDVQVDVPNMSTLYKVENQFFATPPIPADVNLEMQFKLNYNTTYSQEIEYNVDKFINDAKLNMQWIQSAAYEGTIDVSYMTLIESVVKIQGRIIPIGNALTSAQMKLLSTLKSPLEIQFSNEVSKNFNLDKTFNISVEHDSSLDTQSFASVNMNYAMPIQIPVENITKNCNLDVQYVLREDIDESMEVSNMTVIEMDSSLEITVFNEVAKGAPIELQTFVAICKEYNLDMQHTVTEITKDENLELQFDILDLVYYMMYEGYNLLPWWSDGKGHWDQSIDKNWDKEDTDFTTADNLVEQLNNLDLDIEVGETLDVGTKNFMYYREFMNCRLDNRVLKLINKNEKKYLTLGKSKRDKSDTFEFAEGDNVFFYDGLEETFNAAVRDQIEDKITHTLKWLPQTGKWNRFTEDTEVYFYEDIDGKEMPMPYVFIVNVTEDCSISINR